MLVLIPHNVGDSVCMGMYWEEEEEVEKKKRRT